MNICTRCVLPSSFPGIYFDERGVCNHCVSSRDAGSAEKEKAACRKEFELLLGRIKGAAEYDCAVSYSGGKDSTYTLWILREIFGLNVLALTFDNGFLSDQAFRNIRTVTENLGVDGIIFKADFGLLKALFRAAAEKPLYSPKTLERASTICTSCIGLAKFALLKIALERRIPLTAWGWTPGQAPLRSAVMKINPALFRSTQEALRKPMEAVAGPAINRYFLREEDFSSASFPYTVSPLAFMDYDERSIVRSIQALGWVAPSETDSNSTNCLLNSFANRAHFERHGFHPYAFEIAGMVRAGAMSREDGLSKLAGKENEATTDAARKRLGF